MVSMLMSGIRPVAYTRYIRSRVTDPAKLRVAVKNILGYLVDYQTIHQVIQDYGTSTPKVPKPLTTGPVGAVGVPGAPSVSRGTPTAYIGPVGTARRPPAHRTDYPTMPAGMSGRTERPANPTKRSGWTTDRITRPVSPVCRPARSKKKLEKLALLGLFGLRMFAWDVAMQPAIDAEIARIVSIRNFASRGFASPLLIWLSQ